MAGACILLMFIAAPAAAPAVAMPLDTLPGEAHRPPGGRSAEGGRGESRVQAVTIAGESIDGVWSGSDGTEIVLLQDGAPRRLPLSDLSILRWAISAATAPASEPQADRVTVHLSDGGRLSARILGGDGRSVRLESPLAGKLDVPMSGLGGIRFQPDSEEREAQAAFDAALAQPDDSQDMLFSLRDGRLTTVRGVTELINQQGGSFRWRDRSVPIQLDRVYGIVFAAGVGGRQPAPALCMLGDGTRLGGRITGGEQGHVDLQLSGGGHVRLPVTELVEIRLRSDRVVFLSDLQPAEYVFEPFALTQWPYRVDRSVTNQPMRMERRTYERGIGMHSQAVLKYALQDSFSRFAAIIGIDDAARPLGNVVFRVLADGREVYNSGPITGRDAPREIVVPIDGARELELAVDFGEDLDIGDHANWANARLLR